VGAGWIVGGILIALVWIGAGALMVPFLLMGLLMANDSGAATAERHMGLIAAVLSGHGLLTLAGVPLGLTFFWRGRRKWCAAGFLAMLVLGVAAYAAGLMSF
jgi:hypothetical protein